MHTRVSQDIQHNSISLCKVRCYCLSLRQGPALRRRPLVAAPRRFWPGRAWLLWVCFGSGLLFTDNGTGCSCARFALHGWSLRVSGSSFRKRCIGCTLRPCYLHRHYLCLWQYCLRCFALPVLSLLLGRNCWGLDLFNQVLSFFGYVCPELGIFALCWPCSFQDTSIR